MLSSRAGKSIAATAIDKAHEAGYNERFLPEFLIHDIVQFSDDDETAIHVI